jgi:hypothetical protein
MMLIFSGLCLGFLSDVFSSGASTKILFIFLITLIRVTCPNYFISICILILPKERQLWMLIELRPQTLTPFLFTTQVF